MKRALHYTERVLAALVISAVLAGSAGPGSVLTADGQAPTRATPHMSTTMTAATPSLRAALALTAAGATMFWSRRLADDTALAARTGREHEASGMIRGPLPFGAIPTVVMLARASMFTSESE